MSVAFNAIVSSDFELGLSKKLDDDGCRVTTSPVHQFFSDIYQQQPVIYRSSTGRRSTDHTTTEEDCTLRQAVTMNWNDVAALLHHCRHDQKIMTPCTLSPPSPPLFFQNGTPITDPHTLYASNPHAAYLDGCSIIINYADLHHPIIANLCNDLQRTFPHVYANAYLTPPNSYAVPAHADDRDVLVMQILGSKRWKIYKHVPVEYPFDEEQVGKNGNVIDTSVLNDGGLCFRDKEVILYPGDVLYLPRGFVHEASTMYSAAGLCGPSFHITVAIATHDWCLSVLLSETVRRTLDDVTEFRKALPIGPCEEYETGTTAAAAACLLKVQLNEAMSIIQSKITPSVIEQNLRNKYQRHNARANEYRQRLIMGQQVVVKKRKADDDDDDDCNNKEECVVGPIAASCLTLNSVIRVSTPEERNSVTIDEGRLRGLTVRAETKDIKMSILSRFKNSSLPPVKVAVEDLLSIMTDEWTHDGSSGEGLHHQLSMVCNFTLLSFARCCVELGALAIVL